MSKTTFKQIMAFALCSAAGSSGMASAATCPPADTKMAGHYYLHGIRDVGSELLLRPDGRFEYGLSYGATEEAAAGGCWSHSGDRIILTSDRPSSLPKSTSRSMDLKQISMDLSALTRAIEGNGSKRSGVRAEP